MQVRTELERRPPVAADAEPVGDGVRQLSDAPRVPVPVPVPRLDAVEQVGERPGEAAAELFRLGGHESHPFGGEKRLPSSPDRVRLGTRSCGCGKPHRDGRQGVHEAGQGRPELPRALRRGARPRRAPARRRGRVGAREVRRRLGARARRPPARHRAAGLHGGTRGRRGARRRQGGAHRGIAEAAARAPAQRPQPALGGRGTERRGHHRQGTCARRTPTAPRAHPQRGRRARRVLHRARDRADPARRRARRAAGAHGGRRRRAHRGRPAGPDPGRRRAHRREPRAEPGARGRRRDRRRRVPRRCSARRSPARNPSASPPSQDASGWSRPSWTAAGGRRSRRS